MPSWPHTDKDCDHQQTPDLNNFLCCWWQKLTKAPVCSAREKRQTTLEIPVKVALLSSNTCHPFIFWFRLSHWHAFHFHTSHYHIPPDQTGIFSHKNLFLGSVPAFHHKTYPWKPVPLASMSNTLRSISVSGSPIPILSALWCSLVQGWKGWMGTWPRKQTWYPSANPGSGLGSGAMITSPGSSGWNWLGLVPQTRWLACKG